MLCEDAFPHGEEKQDHHIWLSGLHCILAPDEEDSRALTPTHALLANEPGLLELCWLEKEWKADKKEPLLPKLIS